MEDIKVVNNQKTTEEECLSWVASPKQAECLEISKISKFSDLMEPK